MIQPRMSLPALASARVSSVSRSTSRSFMRLARPDWSKKARKASAVVANPPGTLTPASASWLIISPKDAFFPPTFSRSFIPSWSSHKIYSLTGHKSYIDDA